MQASVTDPRRFNYLLTLFVVAALIIGSISVAVGNERRFLSDRASATAVQARILAETVAGGLAFDDRAALVQSVDALKADPAVDAVGIYGTNGRRVVSFSRSPLAETLAETRKPDHAGGRFVVIVPVSLKDVRLGTVYLRELGEKPLVRLSRYAGPLVLMGMAGLLFVVMALNTRTLSRANQRLVDEMAARERAEAALRQSQKMEAVGRLTGGIAHDFNNMLAIVQGSLDLLLRRHSDSDPRAQRLAQQAMEGAKRASALTQRLLAFSRLQPLKPVPTDVAKTVSDMTDLLRRTLGETIAIETLLAGGLWRAFIDVSQLETAIVNLAINARDAMPGGGKLTLAASNAQLEPSEGLDEPDLQPGPYVLLAVTDTGVGMSKEIFSKVFEPFFTTKPVGVGTGLGLSQVHGFIKQSGGHIRIASAPGEGTTVQLFLPRTLEEVTPLETAPPRSGVKGRRDVTVLIVEDEVGVRQFASEALIDLGFDVLAASSGRTALEVLEREPEIRVLLTDVVMPEMNGRELADEALKRRPELKVVFMTGYTRDAMVHKGVLDRGTHLLNKPFSVAQLEAELDTLLNGAR